VGYKHVRVGYAACACGLRTHVRVGYARMCVWATRFSGFGGPGQFEAKAKPIISNHEFYRGIRDKALLSLLAVRFRLSRNSDGEAPSTAKLNRRR
jgi:hypothetical protein